VDGNGSPLTKVIGYLLGGLGDDWHVQTAADHASDVSERHALFGDPVIPGSCGTLLKHEPVVISSIEPEHRGPAVEPVATYAETPFSRAKTMRRNEAVITVAMDRLRKAYHRHTHATRRGSK
jgi:hypothetical protein